MLFLTGSGALFIITIAEVAEPLVQSFLWSDSLFSLTWSEQNENVVVAGSGDGSLLVYDITNPKVSLSNYRAE